MIRAYIGEDRLGWNVDITLIMEAEGLNPTRILRADGDERAWRWQDLPDDTSAVAPTMTLNVGEARALLDALTRHYQGAEDTRALRRDYDHERGRVDKLTDALALLAQTLAGPVA